MAKGGLLVLCVLVAAAWSLPFGNEGVKMPETAELGEVDAQQLFSLELNTQLSIIKFNA